LLGGALLLLTPGRAAAASNASCANAVVADWYGDGRVDQIYPIHCYTDAIRSLPVDVLDYSNAKEDILRALSFAKRGQADPGDAGAGGGSKGSGDTSTTPTTPFTPGGTSTDDPGDTDSETVAGGGGVDTSGPSSVPVPLLVLGGLALLLLAAGGAGYLNRRGQSRNGDGPDDPAL
jgi:Alphavirus glycoprotein J